MKIKQLALASSFQQYFYSVRPEFGQKQLNASRSHQHLLMYQKNFFFFTF